MNKDLLFSLNERKESMVDQLHQLCLINSGTENMQGLSLMHQALKNAYTNLADQIETVEFPLIQSIAMNGERLEHKCGNALFIRKRPQLKNRVLLCGHMDTVYDAAHPFQTLTYISENQLNGPGVTDMKGGLVVMHHALMSFEEMASNKNLGWDIFINADEEIGSPASSLFIDKIASNYHSALVYEPAIATIGTLAKNRRGSGKFTLVANGKSAHVGRAFSEGRNAICYLMEVLLAINALNNNKNGITINVGKIAGGEALNMVPDKAVAKLDIRVSSAEDEQWVLRQLNKICETHQRNGYQLILDGSFHRPVKRVNKATEALFLRLQHLGQKLGLTLNWQDSGGCCDGNNLAQHGLAVIDTLGVRGGNIHSENEFILLDSLVERSALTALLLNDFAESGFRERKNDAFSQCL